MKKKTVALLMACVMALGVAVGGTMAWLTDKTDSVQNVFTTSNIDITLTETTGNEYKMIPGFTIDKDPVVTVKTGSEDCWLFIKVAEEGVTDSENVSYTFDQFIDYKIDGNNWTKLDGEENVYYCYANDITADRKIKVLLNQQISVKETVTKEMMDNLEKMNGQPTLTFTAYAHQLYKNNTEKFTAAEAWKSINGTTATP